MDPISSKQQWTLKEIPMVVKTKTVLQTSAMEAIVNLKDPLSPSQKLLPYQQEEGGYLRPPYP